MKPDRIVIASVLCLSAGLWLIFGYCHGTAGMSLGSALSAWSLNMSITTNGPGAPGGLALTVLGGLLLIWALILSIWGSSGGMGESLRGRSRRRLRFRAPCLDEGRACAAKEKPNFTRREKTQGEPPLSQAHTAFTLLGPMPCESETTAGKLEPRVRIRPMRSGLSGHIPAPGILSPEPTPDRREQSHARGGRSAGLALRMHRSAPKPLSAGPTPLE